MGSSVNPEGQTENSRNPAQSGEHPGVFLEEVDNRVHGRSPLIESRSQEERKNSPESTRGRRRVKDVIGKPAVRHRGRVGSTEPAAAVGRAARGAPRTLPKAGFECPATR